eukprot:1395427-Pyramimonas_sp.AAC.1
MLYGTELFDLFILVQSDIAVLILGVSHSTVGACVLVELTLTQGLFNAFDRLVNSVLRTGHLSSTCLAESKLLLVSNSSS